MFCFINEFSAALVNPNCKYFNQYIQECLIIPIAQLKKFIKIQLKNLIFSQFGRQGASQDRCDLSTNIKITNCGHFYVYWLNEIDGRHDNRTSNCDYRYCTDIQYIFALSIKIFPIAIRRHREMRKFDLLKKYLYLNECFYLRVSACLELPPSLC